MTNTLVHSPEWKTELQKSFHEFHKDYSHIKLWAGVKTPVEIADNFLENLSNTSKLNACEPDSMEMLRNVALVIEMALRDFTVWAKNVDFHVSPRQVTQMLVKAATAQAQATGEDKPFHGAYAGNLFSYVEDGIVGNGTIDGITRNFSWIWSQK